MMMIRVLFWLMAVGAVIGCQVENTETSGVLVNPNSEQEVPEWVSIADVDHNRDGVITIQDLVIVSRFLGKEVPEGEMASAGDESDPCRDIRADQSISDVNFIVRDNSRFKKLFDASGGDSYVYALLATRKTGVSVDKEGRGTPAHEVWPQHLEPSCVAIRLKVGLNDEDNTVIKEFKAKFLGRDGSLTPREITTSISEIWRATSSEPTGQFRDRYQAYSHMGDWPTLREKSTSFYMRLPPEGTPVEEGYGSNINLILEVWHTVNMMPDAHETDYWSNKARKFITKGRREGIQISNEEFVPTLEFGVVENDYLIVNYKWSIVHPDDEENIRKPFSYNKKDFKGLVEYYSPAGGAYVKMLPAEVRRRYFREDEATGN